MLYIETTKEDWIQKYSLEPEKFICKYCKQSFETSTPIRIKGYAGLETPEHGCGKKSLSAIFKPIDREEISFWNNPSVETFSS